MNIIVTPKSYQHLYLGMYLCFQLDIRSIFAFQESKSSYFYLKLRNKFITCGYNREIGDSLW